MLLSFVSAKEFNLRRCCLSGGDDVSLGRVIGYTSKHPSPMYARLLSWPKASALLTVQPLASGIPICCHSMSPSVPREEPSPPQMQRLSCNRRPLGPPLFRSRIWKIQGRIRPPNDPTAGTLRPDRHRSAIVCPAAPPSPGSEPAPLHSAGKGGEDGCPRGEGGGRGHFDPQECVRPQRHHLAHSSLCPILQMEWGGRERCHLTQP